jgi:putative DNA methylase
MTRYPKRLIEVDLPIRRISIHARREKSIRHGHISTLHIWWARRPLAACRAVICAALWPDPVDVSEQDVEAARKDGRALEPNVCPPAFRAKAKQEMLAWTSFERQMLLSEENRVRFDAARKKPVRFDDALELRGALLDFIADFANWDNSTVPEYLATARSLTQAAHEALGGQAGTRPLVVDPFAGGGSIPLEALRVGADTFASDLNPVAVLLNKVVLEYIPKYGQRLAVEVRKWGEWIKSEAEKELAEFYPKDVDGATPIAYLWARTIQCEGPGCGAEVPLIRSLWLSKRKANLHALKLVPDRSKKRVEVKIVPKPVAGTVGNGTVAKGSATCPCCGYTTPATAIRKQLKALHGGSETARLLCVVTTRQGESGRYFRLPNEQDVATVRKAEARLAKLVKAHRERLSLVPDERVNPLPHSVNRLPIYGMSEWGHAFMPRQALTLATFTQLVKKCRAKLNLNQDQDISEAIQSVLALAVSRLADICNALCPWSSGAQQVVHLFGRQAIPMTWDFAETSPVSGASGDFSTTIGNMLRLLERETHLQSPGHAEMASATQHPLPDNAAQSFVTDPPYYDSISYADLSDFFYVWLRRSLQDALPDLFGFEETPKAKEIIVEPTSVTGVGVKDQKFYLDNMGRAMTEARRVLQPSGIGIIVFAHKSTAGWEAQLQGMMQAGLIVTASWPIDTEREDKVSGIGQARLGSSIHLVCRPRENPDGSLRADGIGDWRDVLQELPRRIHEWMPRLAEEGVVGADAIFACLGPALEIFSRHSHVEKASGEAVSLKEYLEHVWAAVAKEALAQVFKDADTTGFEPDARITAMWLWTLTGGARVEASNEKEDLEDDDADEQSGTSRKAKPKGFVLEFDAARKIAQGLGATLEDLSTVVEVKGDTARLLPVSERATMLFGKDAGQTPTMSKKKKDKQLKLGLFDELIDETKGEIAWKEKAETKLGETTLDRIHQSMILFAAGRGEAMKRFLVDDGAGQDQRFWRLAQALSALYPSSSDEKRWVDGVLARKKGLGL